MVFTLGPPGSIRVDPARLQQLGSLLTQRAGGGGKGGGNDSDRRRDGAIPSASASASSMTEDYSGSASSSAALDMSPKQLQQISARLDRNPYLKLADPPLRFPYPSDLLRADLITEEHLMQVCERGGREGGGMGVEGARTASLGREGREG